MVSWLIRLISFFSICSRLSYSFKVSRYWVDYVDICWRISCSCLILSKAYYSAAILSRSFYSNSSSIIYCVSSYSFMDISWSLWISICYFYSYSFINSSACIYCCCNLRSRSCLYCSSNYSFRLSNKFFCSLLAYEIILSSCYRNSSFYLLNRSYSFWFCICLCSSSSLIAISI